MKGTPSRGRNTSSSTSDNFFSTRNVLIFAMVVCYAVAKYREFVVFHANEQQGTNYPTNVSVKLTPKLPLELRPKTNNVQPKEPEVVESTKKSVLQGVGEVPSPTVIEASKQAPKEASKPIIAPTSEKKDDDVHHSNVGVLDLVDWEQESLDGMMTHVYEDGFVKEIAALQSKAAQASCNPPDGVAKECCIGTFSGGGFVTPKYRYNCARAFLENATESQWLELKQRVRDFYNENQPSNGVDCDVCQIVELARQQHLNITLIGDSMQSQVYEGLKCEIQRRGFVTEETRIRHPSEFQTNTNIGTTTILTVKSPTWDDPILVNFTYHNIYYVPAGNESKALFDDMYKTSQVLVLGFGLHWKWIAGGAVSREAYAPAIKALLDQASATDGSSNVKLVAHRETTYQHFDVPGGDYKVWKSKRDAHPGEVSFQCVAARDDPEITYWREKFLHKAITDEYNILDVTRLDKPLNGEKASEEKRNVYILPYHNFSQSLHMMHQTAREGKSDCTHYCGSPFMYMPLWRSLRLAMDHRFT